MIEEKRRQESVITLRCISRTLRRSDFQLRGRRIIGFFGICIVLFAPRLYAQGQTIAGSHLSYREGLGGREVHCILQDSRGFMWFGTEEGLNRYDGYSVIVYRHEAGNPASIVGAKVQSLLEDKRGTLWVGTWRGLDRFDRASNTFSHFLPDAQQQGDAPRNVIYSMHEDRNGTLWLGTLDGLDTLDRETGRFTCFRHDSSDPGSLIAQGVNAIYEDKAGTLWLGTQGGLDRYDPGTNSFVHYWSIERSAAASESLAFSSNRWIQTICEDRAGTLWLGTNQGPVAFDRKKGSFTPYQINGGEGRAPGARSVSSVLEDNSGTLWIGTWGGGLMSYDSRTDRFVSRRDEKRDPAALTYPGICALYRDRSGVMWIGTNGDGVANTVRLATRFTPFTHGADVTGLSDNDVRFIYQDLPGGLVSIGTNAGIDRFDPKRGRFFDPSSFERPYSVTGEVRSRFGEFYYTGIHGDGFNVIHERPYRRTYFSTNKIGLGGSACSLFEDRQGVVWMMLSSVGLCQFDPRSEKFTELSIGQFQLFVSARLIVEERYDSGVAKEGWGLWIGTNDGLWRYDAAVNAFARFGHDPKDPGSLTSNTVNTVFRDSEGRLWIGTDRGLNKMQSVVGQFECYTVDNGLPDNSVLGILEDGQGRIWVSTSKSLSRLDPRTGRFSSYAMKDYLPGIRFSPGCCLRSTDGEMYFGGSGGFVLFNPDSIRDNPYVPPIAITGFRRFDAPAVFNDAAENVIELSYQDNVFSFDFAALSYTKPEDNQFAYRLDGYDTSWIYCGNRQYARYTNVTPGSYTFRVKGSNNDGVWNEEGTSIAVIIAPPLWKTWWAYSIYGIIIMGMLYTFRRYEMNRQSLRHGYELKMLESIKLKELDGLKSRFFANISHELRTPLTLILGPTEELQSALSDDASREKLSMVHRNAQRLLRLINQLLDLSKLEAGKMDLKSSPGNIVPFARGIAQSFQPVAGIKGIALDVKAEKEEIELWFNQDMMEKILTNLLSNAFKFTKEGGEVTVSLTTVSPFPNPENGSEGVQISVADTGIGIPPEELPHVFDRFYQVDASQTREHEGSGIGLALTKELVELHHGIISVNSEIGRGTEFVVSFPLGKEHLRPEEITDVPLVVQPLIREEFAAVPTEYGSVAPGLPAELSQEQPVVLVVEDTADVRTYIRGCLAPAYLVLEAVDGEEGVEKARESIPDLIISDVMMPKMDGNELCRTLKLDEITSHVPIILLTAKAGQENKIEGLETGADDYLTKPFDAKELLVRAKNLIESRRKLRARFSAGQVLRPGEIAVTSVDDAFLNKVTRVVVERMGNEAFSVEEFALEAGMSRSQLHRKLTALTGQSPTDFVRYMRLHRAMELLKKNAGTVSEIAYSVGFSGVSYFTKCFKEQFGTLPSEVNRV